MNRRKIIAACVLFLFVFVAVGCETTKGVAKGVAQGIGTTIDGTAKGAVKDTKGFAGAIMALDDWIKRNLW